MAQVPYKPVPNVAPQAPPTPSIHLDAPGAAFGENVAQAQQKQGAAEEQAGNTLFGEALKLQSLQNESWAKGADVDVMIKIGKAQSEFDQKEGMDAINALPAHMERIKAIREEAIAGSPNPEARRFLDNSISRRVGFAIVDAGARAGQQVKVAANAASEARVQTAVRTFDPASPGGRQQAMETIRREVEEQGRTHGSLPETVENEVNKQQSAAFLAGLVKQAPVNPEGANKSLEQNKEWLDPKTRDAAQGIVNSNMARHQSRTDASDLLNGKEVAGVKVEPFDPQKGPGQLQKYLDAAKAVAEKKGKGNPDFPDALEGRVRANFQLGIAGYNDAQRGARNDLSEFVTNNKIVDEDALAGPNATPEMRDKWNTLNESGKQSMRKLMESVSKPRQNTLDRQQRFDTLMGMATPDGNPEKFFSMDLESEDITLTQLSKLNSVKRNLIQRIHDDQGFTKVMSDLNNWVTGPQGAGLKKDSDDYFQFKGAFHHEWLQWKQDNKQSVMPYDEAHKMAQRLVLSQSNGSKWNPMNWFGGKKNYEIPDEAVQELTKRFKDGNMDRAPTATELRGMYDELLDVQHKKAKNAGQ